MSIKNTNNSSRIIKLIDLEYLEPPHLNKPYTNKLKWQCIFCGAKKSKLKRISGVYIGTITYCQKHEQYADNMVNNMVGCNLNDF